LRKDLHALYDNGLLKINAESVVELHGSVMEHYKQFSGLRIPSTRIALSTPAK
jgi:hypothetical protein